MSIRATSPAASRSSRAVELPFIFSNAREGSAALDAWYRRYAAQEMKDVRYCLAFAHDPGTFHFTRKKVVMPADVAGLKVRPPNAVIASWMRMLGAVNVQAAAPEIRDVLEKGVADAAGSPWGSMALFGIDTRHQIPHRRAVLCVRAGLGAQQGQIRRAVRRRRRP